MFVTKNTDPLFVFCYKRGQFGDDDGHTTNWEKVMKELVELGWSPIKHEQKLKEAHQWFDWGRKAYIDAMSSPH